MFRRELILLPRTELLTALGLTEEMVTAELKKLPAIRSATEIPVGSFAENEDVVYAYYRLNVVNNRQNALEALDFCFTAALKRLNIENHDGWKFRARKDGALVKIRILKHTGTLA